jgi:hypothetical protein
MGMKFKEEGLQMVKIGYGYKNNRIVSNRTYFSLKRRVFVLRARFD